MLDAFAINQTSMFANRSASVVLPDYVQVTKTSNDQIDGHFGSQKEFRVEISRTFAAEHDRPADFGIYLVNKLAEKHGLKAKTTNGRAVVAVPPSIKTLEDGQIIQFFNFSIGTKHTVLSMTLTTPPVQKIAPEDRTKINDVINSAISSLSEQ
jgi:hypothetical protein